MCCQSYRKKVPSYYAIQSQEIIQCHRNDEDRPQNDIEKQWKMQVDRPTDRMEGGIEQINIFRFQF